MDNNEEPERSLSSIDEVARFAFGNEYSPQQRDEVQRVVDVFAAEGANFIYPSTTADGQDALDISHESLLRQWRTFRGWLTQEKESAARFRRLDGAASAYHKVFDGNREGGLLERETLASLEWWWKEEEPTPAWAERYSPQRDADGELNSGVFERAAQFLQVSRAVENRRVQKERDDGRKLERAERDARKTEELRLRAEAETARERAAEQEAKAQSRRRWLIGVWTFAVLAVVACGVAVWFQREAHDAQTAAESARSEAVGEKKNAEGSAKLADEQKQLAELAEARAVKHRRRAEKLLYTSQVRFAADAWDRGDVSEAWNHLNAAQWNHRHWEHDYFYSEFTRGQTTLKGHAGSIRSVSFSPDGERIVSGSEDNTVKVWDAETGQETLTLTGHTDSVRSVSFSPDGERIVSGSEDNTVKVWDAETGQETLTLTGHTDSVWSVSFSPDGERIVSGSDDNTVKVWDAETGQETLTIKGHTDSVRGVSFSPDGERIASGSEDNTVKVWDAETGQETLTLTGHTDYVWSVSFSPDGQWIVSGGGTDQIDGKPGEIRLWNALTGDLLKQFSGHTDTVLSVRFDHSARRIVSGGVDRFLRIWDVETGEQLLAEGDDGFVFDAAFDSTGTRVVSACSDGTVKVWLQARHTAGPVTEFPVQPITHVAPSDDPGTGRGHVTDVPHRDKPQPERVVGKPMEVPGLRWLLLTLTAMVAAVVLLALASRQRRR